MPYRKPDSVAIQTIIITIELYAIACADTIIIPLRFHLVSVVGSLFGSGL